MALKSIHTEFTREFAGLYDTYRPRAPRILTRLLSGFGRIRNPMVADLGSGTGLSTFEWLGVAQQVVGIEPSPDFREFAATMIGAGHPHAEDIRFVSGRGEETGLDAGSCDVVTCGESLHWMEPRATLREVARVLRPAGLFAAYTHVLPPVIDREVDQAFTRYIERVKDAEKALKQCMFGNYEWKPKDFEAGLEDAGPFPFVRRVYLHNDEQRNADEVVGLARAFADVQWLVSRGVTDAPAWLDELKGVVTEVMGQRRVPCTTGATLVMAVRESA